MKIKDYENYQKNILEDVEKYLEKSEMTKSEQQFLNGIILQKKPKKILEVGVAAGGSSIVILNAIKDIDDAQLYSIDKNENYYVNNEYKTGYLIEKFLPHLKDKWKLYTGGITASFIENIANGKEIDLCVLDTVHHVPGELLDILMILPFMKKDGIIVLHDVMYNCLNYKIGISKKYKCFNNKIGISNNVLFSVVKAEKILPNFSEYFVNGVPYPNIGAFIINEETLNNVDDIFFSLSLNWAYIPEEKDIEIMRKLFMKYYNEENIKKFDIIYEFYKKESESLKYRINSYKHRRSAIICFKFFQFINNIKRMFIK
ncbi:MAG: class I SAM-dependent methyltransferase [Methanobrevibacter sp.]|jgi:predicted O-methyltransferase YrrM|nr:class I SAM-dependent methyltransferase [Candidatus Methanovirga meridionalis]